MKNFKRISKILELDKILNRLATFTRCKDSKKLATGIVPSTSLEFVQKINCKTDEALVAF